MKYYVKTSWDENVPVRNIYCIGRNYRAHAAELNNEVPKQPFFFQKSLPSLNTSREIIVPDNRDIHHELEVVILVQKNGENINEADVQNHIGGFALGLDLTDRNFQNELKEKNLPWLLSKSFKGSAVVSRFQSKPIEEDFWLKINGLFRQKGNVKDMVFSIPKQVSYLSEMIPLLAGDLIFTGTPSGVGPIHTGDKLELGIGEHSIHSIVVS